MRRILTTWMLAFLLLAPVACGAAEPGEEETGTTAEESEAGAPDASEADGEAGEDEALADAGAAADEAAAGESDAAGEEGAADAAAEEGAEPGPTLSPEEVDLITNFRPPSKGSEDALVTVYEFSDYI